MCSATRCLKKTVCEVCGLSSGHCLGHIGARSAPEMIDGHCPAIELNCSNKSFTKKMKGQTVFPGGRVDVPAKGMGTKCECGKDLKGRAAVAIQI